MMFSRMKGQTRDPIVDVEKLLVDYAWNKVADKSCWDKLCRSKKYALEVNWSYFDISHSLGSFVLRSASSDPSQHWANIDVETPERENRNQREQDKKEKDKRKAEKKVVKRDLCLFRTEFTNKSTEAQTFTFKTERKTTSRVDVNVQRGYCIASKIDVGLSIPTVPQTNIDPCTITGGLSSELRITKTTNQCFEEMLTWGVDSQVKVEKESRVTASLLIREEEVSADFIVQTTFAPKYGFIPVYVRNKKSRKLLRILEIPKERLNRILTEGKGFIKADDLAVVCETKGSLRAVYGAEQMIQIDSDQLSSLPAVLHS